VASLKHIVTVLPPQALVDHVWPLVQRFGGRDWFTSRTSACGLLPTLYSRLSAASRTAGGGRGGAAGGDGKEAEGDRFTTVAAEAFALFSRLSVDDVPMVRRAASHAFHDMGTALAGGVLAPPAVGPSPATGPTEPLTAGSGAGIMAEDSKMIEDTGRVVGARSSTGGAAGVGSTSTAAGGAGSGSTRDGFNVDTGDMSAAAVPPPVPQAIVVSAASLHDGAVAATNLLPLLNGFSRDDQDSVRLLAVDDCVALAWLVNGGMVDVVHDAAAEAAILSKNTDVRSAVVNAVLSLAGDRAWRVRWSLANRFSELASAFGRAITSERLLPVFQVLLTDGESEVRTAASYRVSDVGALVGKERIMEVVSVREGGGGGGALLWVHPCALHAFRHMPVVQLLPCMVSLADDASEFVRAALASVILGVAPVLGRDTTVESLLPLFLKLLKDASAQVRLNIISKLEAVNAVIGLSMLSQSLLPAIQELSSDKQWRVRLAIIEFMPLLARQLGAGFFDTELTDLCVKWLSDPVYAIRDAACTNLRKLAEVFDSAWAEHTLVPRVLAMRAEGSYQTRMTCLAAGVVRCRRARCGGGGGLRGRFGVQCARSASARTRRPVPASQTLGQALDAATLQRALLPFLLAFARDPIPNIRFNVAKAVERLAGKLDRGVVESTVRPVLNELALDSSADVQYYATKALATL